MFANKNPDVKASKMAIPIYLLFILIILLPAGTLISACFGYTFTLFSVSVFAVATAMLSVYTVVLHLVFKCTPESRVLQILLALIAPLSFVHAVFYLIACSRIWIVASVLISAGCCCFLAGKLGKPLALKIVALVLSGLLALPVAFIGFIALIFGNIGQNTVVQSLESPGGKYCAQIIDSNQGALGGDTLVEVHEKGGVNAILFRVEKAPQLVYVGEWGEFENMQIYWKDDACLVINSAEHEIE